MAIPELTTSDRVVVLLRHSDDSLSDLADCLGLHRVSLSRKMGGESTWRVAEIQAIAARYDVPVGWLLGDAS
jgi:hypothetical protein